MSDRRPAPKRVRVTRLQETQLAPLAALEKACAEQYHEVGFDAAEVPPRSVAEITALTRDHNLHVAEADHEPAGYLAWRDESPGIAYIAELSVHPELQRHGIASRLVETLHEDARAHGLSHLAVRCWTKAPWAMAFYTQAGFTPIDAAAPAKVQSWKTERSQGRPFTRPGEVALWALVAAAPAAEEEDADPDATPDVS
jgi:GNAT superfamily N-acetyltransferase